MTRTRGDAIILAAAAAFPAPDEVVRRIRPIKGVAAAEPFFVVEANLLSRTRVISRPLQGRGEGALARTAPFVVAGDLAPLQARDALFIALGKEMADDLGVTVGDEIGVTPVAASWDGLVESSGGTFVPVRVAAVLEMPGGPVVGLGDHEAVMSLDAAAKLERAAGGSGDAHGVVVFLEDDAADDALSNVRAVLNDPTYRIIGQEELNRGLRRTRELVERWCASHP